MASPVGKGFVLREGDAVRFRLETIVDLDGADPTHVQLGRLVVQRDGVETELAEVSSRVLRPFWVGDLIREGECTSLTVSNAHESCGVDLYNLYSALYQADDDGFTFNEAIVTEMQLPIDIGDTLVIDAIFFSAYAGSLDWIAPLLYQGMLDVAAPGAQLALVDVRELDEGARLHMLELLEEIGFEYAPAAGFLFQPIGIERTRFTLWDLLEEGPEDGEYLPN